MNAVDVAVLVVAALSGLVGLSRGLVREVLGLGAWAGAGAASLWLQPEVLPATSSLTTNPALAAALALGGVFLAALIVLSVIARAGAGLVRQSALGGLDRTLGLGFGLARGAALLVAAYVAAGVFAPATDTWPRIVLEARSLHAIYLAAAWATDQVPQPYRPVLAQPPAAQPTRSADLLHASRPGRRPRLRPASRRVPP